MITEKSIKTTHEVAGTPALIGRRSFLKGIGLAATTAAIGGPGVLISGAVENAEAAVPAASAGLAGSPAVLLCRHASELGRCRDTVGASTGLPVLHQDADAIFFDGGSLVLAYERGSRGSEAAGLPRPRLLAEPHRLQPNPCSTVLHLPAGERAGQCFLDGDGNQSGFFDPSRLAGGGPERRKLQEIRSRGAGAPVGALELLVSDLPRATEFYSETLGLRVLSKSGGETTLDLGTILLVLRPEPTGMLVDLLRRTGRLLGDWAVFHVADIGEAVAGLRARGARLPWGIETLPIGRVASLSDPDGHPWVLWQPSEPAKTLAYYPALSRLLARA